LLNLWKPKNESFQILVSQDHMTFNHRL
jgi:hypothetical protein